MPFGWAQGRLRLRFTAQILRLRSGRQCRDRRLLIWHRFRGTSLCQFGRRHHGSAGVSPASIRPVPNPLWREPAERKLPTEPPINLGHHPTNQHIPQYPPIPKITVQTTPLVSFVDNPRHSNRPPVIPATAGIQRGEAAGHHTNHKNPTNHSSDNPLRALSGQSPSFQPPTRHSGGGRNPEGRGRGESH